MSKKDFLWDKVHEELKSAMEKEITMMREILANMHREELALNIDDKGAWAHIIEERAQMLLRLSDLRVDRIEATKKLENLATAGKNDHVVPLEQLLPSADANSFEILSMRDQMMALIDRMNSQNTHNEQLYQHSSHRFTPSYALPPAPANVAPHKPKASLATYPRKQ